MASIKCPVYLVQQSQSSRHLKKLLLRYDQNNGRKQEKTSNLLSDVHSQVCMFYVLCKPARVENSEKSKPAILKLSDFP